MSYMLCMIFEDLRLSFAPGPADIPVKIAQAKGQPTPLRRLSVISVSINNQLKVRVVYFLMKTVSY